MKLVPILMVDDDEDDCFLTRDAFEESRLKNPLLFVHNGKELLDYLNRRGKFSDAQQYPMPGLILLDLNMPVMDGRTALAHLKADPKLKAIPVVVLTTSREEREIVRTYEMGACSFISKPVEFDELVRTLKTIGDYWFSIVHLPQ